MDLVPNLDVQPFTQFVWRSQEQKLIWEGRLKMARSLHDRAEYEMVKQGRRRCATLHIGPTTYDTQIERIVGDGLVWLPIQRTKMYSGFSHRHYPTSPDDPSATVYGVLARNMEDARLFREASAYDGKVDHNTIGDLLGFPRCCCSFFSFIWPNGYYDPLWQAAVNTQESERISETHIKVKGSIHTNQFLRYTGYRTTSHLPCSLTCQETISVGQIWLDVMRSIDTLGTDALIDILSLPLKWRCYRGVVIVETEAFIVISNSMPTSKEYVVEFTAT